MYSITTFSMQTKFVRSVRDLYSNNFVIHFAPFMMKVWITDSAYFYTVAAAYMQIFFCQFLGIRPQEAHPGKFICIMQK